MNHSSIIIDIDDPRTGQVAEALANKTCVKILGILVEQEYTAGDIASKLGIPLNTAGYNIEKLIASGLIEKSSNFFWSVKGKKTPTYKVANRRIVISPKRLVRGILPVAFISGVVAVILRWVTLPSASKSYFVAKNFADVTSGTSASSDASSIATNSLEVASTFSNNLSGVWIWFFIGALFSLIILLLWNSVSSKMRKFK